MTRDARYPVGATKTTFSVIEALVDAGEPLGVTALANQVDISKSVAHNHLSTLRELGYVVKRDGKYTLSLQLLALGERTRDRLPLYRAARPKLDNLANTTGETATLLVESQGVGIWTYLTAGDGEPPDDVYCGDTIPLNACATGKAIFSQLPSEHVTAIIENHGLPAVTDATITDPTVLRDQLNRIRVDGISFCDGERAVGVREVATPVVDGDGSVVGAIGVAGPAERLTGRHLEEDIAGQVVSTANAIEVALAAE